jgi:hypothetical protein
VAGGPAGCGPSALEGGYNSANPAAKMYAIEHSAETGRVADVPRIVEQLDSDDPAVRLLAITTLEQLTGETHGYRHYDPPDLRREAIARWTRAVDSGRIGPTLEPVRAESR